jgi:hypothetical protein
MLRQAVAALSSRLTGDFGALVPEASTERTAALVAKLEAGGGGVGADELVTLDSWIRLADSAMLHDDAAEAQDRAEIGRRLRAVRAVVAPQDTGLLTPDPRDH